MDKVCNEKIIAHNKYTLLAENIICPSKEGLDRS